MGLINSIYYNEPTYKDCIRIIAPIPIKFPIEDKFNEFLERFTVIDDNSYISAPVLCALFTQFITNEHFDKTSLNLCDSFIDECNLFIKHNVKASSKYNLTTVGFSEYNKSMLDSPGILFFGRKVLNININKFEESYDIIN